MYPAWPPHRVGGLGMDSHTSRRIVDRILHIQTQSKALLNNTEQTAARHVLSDRIRAAMND